jgi:hypothetical protein
MGTDGTMTSGHPARHREGWFMSEIADAAFHGRADVGEVSASLQQVWGGGDVGE